MLQFVILVIVAERQDGYAISLLKHVRMVSVVHKDKIFEFSVADHPKILDQ